MIYPVDYSLIGNECVVNILKDIRTDYNVQIGYYGGGEDQYGRHRDINIYINEELADWYIYFRFNKSVNNHYSFRNLECGYSIAHVNKYSMETFHENFQKKINETMMMRVIDK